MSTISTGTTTTTAFVVTSDTSGELVVKTGPGAGTTALTIDAAQNTTFTNPVSFGIANATTLDATNVEVTNLKAKDGTAAATIANSTGVIAVSTKVEYADGTAAAPTVTNTGDTDTGIYFPAANEVAVTTGGTVAAGFNSNGLFFRNRIINGDMRIDQRNAGASGTSQAPGYPVDRWAYSSSQTSKLTWQQNAGSVTPPAGFTNYLGVTSSSAYTLTGNDYFQIYQVIEGNNVADLAWGTADARPATLSFWVRSSLTGTFGGSLATTKTAVWTLPFTYTISSANTWTYVTVAIPAATSTGGVNTDNSAGIFVRFGLGSAGTSAGGTAGTWVQANYIQPASTVSVVSTNAATWYVTGVQLETGSVATPFERRPYGMELQLCQRYYEKSYDQGTAPGTASQVGGFTYLPANTNTASTLYLGVTVKFSVVKRAGPTIRYWDWAGNLSRVSDLTLGGLTITNNRNTIYVFDAGTSNARVVNTQDALTFSGFYWDAASEL